MVKHFFYLAVGALALTACTSEELVDEVTTNNNLIKFEKVVNKTSRAAEELTNGTLKQFNVYGFYTIGENAEVANEVFDNTSIVYSAGGWDYEKAADIRYWVPGAHYYFYAYSCGNTTKLGSNYGSFSLDTEGKKPVSERTLKITDYKCDADHNHDLVFASCEVEGQTTGNTPVSFQFKHILSKISAQFTSKFHKDYDVVIKNVYIKNICNQADYDLSSTWTDAVRDGEEPTVYLLNTEATTDADAAISVNNVTVKNDEGADVQKTAASQIAFVIPVNYNNLSDNKEVTISFDVDVIYDGESAITATLTGKFIPNWKEGFSYVYNIEVSPASVGLEAIMFTTVMDEEGNMVIDGWETDQEENTTLTATGTVNKKD